MKKIRKITASIMIMVMLVLMAGCGKEGTSEKSSGGKKTDPEQKNVKTEDVALFSAETQFSEYLKDDERGADIYSEDFRKALNDFAVKTAVKIHEQSEDENYIYSPVSLYLALALAADLSDPAVTADLIEILGADSKEDLEQKVCDMIKALSSETNDEGAQAICRIANSVWTDDSLKLSEDAKAAIMNASKNMFADIYNIDLQSAEAVDAMNAWVDEKTCGLIKEIPQEPTAETIMVLFNALYFKKSWETVIDKTNNEEKIFTKPDGSTVKTMMMHANPGRGSYYKSGNSMTAPLYYNDGSYMVFIKPDDGISMETVLNNDLSDIIDAYSSDNRLFSADNIYFTMPIVEYEMTADKLQSIVGELGVKSVFFAADDPFSPLDSELDDKIYISDIIQKCKIIINEEGTEAAAVTEILMECNAIAEESVTIDMTLDHEYAYVLMSANGTPMFIGTVSNPV